MPERLTELRTLWVEDSSGSLTNLTLPEGLTNLRELWVYGGGLTNLTLPKGLVSLERLTLFSFNLSLSTPLTSLKLPEDLGKDTERISSNDSFTDYNFHLKMEDTIEQLSVPYKMKGFRIERYNWGFGWDDLYFPSARELIRNRSPDSDGVFRIKASLPSIIVGDSGVEVDSDGVYRIKSRRPLLVEVYGFQPTLTITRKADGVEIGWRTGILQKSLLIDGPWKDVESGGTERRIFLRPSHPYEFFRIKP